MQKTLMKGLTEKDMQAVVHSLKLAEFYYPTFCPVKYVISDHWKTLEATAGLRIAADVVSLGATKPRKTRETLNRIEGTLPKIAVEMQMKEDEIRAYQQLSYMANSGNIFNDAAIKNQLIATWADDVSFCFRAIASRIEHIFMREISTGKVSFTQDNNAAVVMQYNADYEIPAKQKIGVITSYSAGTDGKPLTVDIPNALEIGRKTYGVNYQYLIMNADTFAKFAQQTEVIKKCSSYVQNIIGSQDSPSPTVVNEFLRNRKDIYRGLQIVVLDDPNIIIEKANGDRNVSNPFEDDVMLFSESLKLGETYYTDTTEAMAHPGDVTIKAVQGHTCIRKYYDENRLIEITDGAANVFPVWNLAGRSILMQTNSNTWTK